METPSVPINPWLEEGYHRDLALLCQWLDELPEEYMFDAETRQVIYLFEQATHVSEFDNYTLDELTEFRDELQQHLPRVQADVYRFIRQVSQSRAVASLQVDFI